jgi:hypothetical protein
MGTSTGHASGQKPWLRNSHWATRKLVDRGGVDWPVFALVYVVGGAILAAVVFGADWGEDWGAPLGIALFFLAALAWVTRFRLRHIRYGDTVCHLITLPGVVGGWFKADVECGLPAEAGTVTVRLRNAADEGTWWSMEQPFNVAPMPGKPARSVVKVRLRVPRDRSQRPFSPSMRFVFGAPVVGNSTWLLELEKNAPRLELNFRAAFVVPIYDTPDAPAEEQQPG